MLRQAEAIAKNPDSPAKPWKFLEPFNYRPKLPRSSFLALSTSEEQDFDSKIVGIAFIENRLLGLQLEVGDTLLGKHLGLQKLFFPLCANSDYYGGLEELHQEKFELTQSTLKFLEDCWLVNFADWDRDSALPGARGIALECEESEIYINIVK